MRPGLHDRSDVHTRCAHAGALIVIHKFILDETPKLKFGLRSPRFNSDETPKLKFGLRSPRSLLTSGQVYFGLCT
jgi:hypothetical protein